MAFVRSPFSPDIPLKMDFASISLLFRSARGTAAPSHWSLAPEGEQTEAPWNEEWRAKVDQEGDPGVQSTIPHSPASYALT